jgi:hypothetical protein
MINRLQIGDVRIAQATLLRVEFADRVETRITRDEGLFEG